MVIIRSKLIAGVALSLAGLGIASLASCQNLNNGVANITSEDKRMEFSNGQTTTYHKYGKPVKTYQNVNNYQNNSNISMQQYSDNNQNPVSQTEVGPAFGSNQTTSIPADTLTDLLRAQDKKYPHPNSSMHTTENNTERMADITINNNKTEAIGTTSVPVYSQLPEYSEQTNYSTFPPQALWGMGPACSPEALNVHIKHYRYKNANPQDLVAVGSRKLHRDAAQSLQQMRAAARADGVTLTVGSAYRSINYQRGIINRKKKRGMSDYEIYSASAPAGYSEHSTGYVVDFVPIEDSFAYTNAYRWLVDNAYRFNWKQSFTQPVAYKSGVMVEPWHWRYEGTPEAKAMFQDRSYACQ